MRAQKFFTELHAKLSPEQMEEYHKAVFMNMEGGFAQSVRDEYYHGVLKHMGENAHIGGGVRIVNPQFISLGDNTQIHNNCTLIANSEKGITLDDGARLKHGVYLDTEVAATGYIRIGKRVYIGAGCCLHGHEGLEIGDDCLLAQNITITPYSHSFDNPAKIIYSQGGIQKKIVIGRDCYLGMNVCIVCTAENIGEGAVVGAGSVVVRSIPPLAIAVGVPAKVLRYRGQIKPDKSKEN
ncbi:MAG: acyltransferase [Verrucomicrobia bacterium]|nr:acyltransferase [Verrucomicrobiota bacterium]MBU1857436.1 acyltransferase [Verrucomicrobiota bacterium]